MINERIKTSVLSVILAIPPVLLAAVIFSHLMPNTQPVPREVIVANEIR